ncbi:uncharacterized protein LOC116603151 [Nematostella vectensis]|uniref:uncharacterized protein LOC116603151 n=1 Tax=Nematostella vectensis TaxID=45351 RepID=UPI002076F2D0|nr:uncharacterized protein LOC116603151 [Nematostella vectensis]
MQPTKHGDKSCEKESKLPLLSANTVQYDASIASCLRLLLRLARRTRPRVASKVAYSLFLSWQFIGLVVFYVPRGVACCLDEEAATHGCNDSIVFPYDKEIELVWMVSHVANIIICLGALLMYKGVSGMRRVMRKLIRNPNFWILMFISLLSAASAFIIVLKTKYEEVSGVGFGIFASFCFQYAVMATMVPILNYTIISKECFYRQKWIIKANLFLMFLVNFTMFVLGSVQLGFHVSGLPGIEDTRLPSKFTSLFLILRRFTNVMFYYTVEKFFWFKMFHDGKDILSHMECLDEHEQVELQNQP